MAPRGGTETIKRKELVGKLNPVCLKAFSAAAQAAKTRGNPYVELVHFFDALSQSARSDFEILCASAGVDVSKLAADITRAVDALPHGGGRSRNSRTTFFRAIQEGWTFGSLEFGDETVRSAYILLGALKVPVLEGLLFKISLEFDKIDPASMAGQLGDLLAESGGRCQSPRVRRRSRSRPPAGSRHCRNTPRT